MGSHGGCGEKYERKPSSRRGSQEADPFPDSFPLNRSCPVDIPPLPLASLAAKAERKGILTAARNQAASVGSCVDAPDSGEVFIPQAILDIFPIIAPSRCLSFCDCIDRDTDHRVLVRWRRLSYEKCQRGKRSRTKIVPNTLRLKVTQEHEAPDSLVPIGERMILETK